MLPKRQRHVAISPLPSLSGHNCSPLPTPPDTMMLDLHSG
jgi:hypothetical protein